MTTNSQLSTTEPKEKQKQKENNQNRMKKQEFKKMRRGLGTSSTTLNVPTSES